MANKTEYGIAKPADANSVRTLVQQTIKSIYTGHYSEYVVNFFCRLHDSDNIGSDINAGKVRILTSKSIQTIYTGMAIIRIRCMITGVTSRMCASAAFLFPALVNLTPAFLKRNR